MLYHSSTTESINNIIENGLSKIKNPNFNQIINGNATYHLGSFGIGFYGFLDNKELSIGFISRELKDVEYATIQFNISLNEDNLIDLASNPDDMRLFSKYWKSEIISAMLEKLKHFYSDKGKAKKLQGALIEYYIIQLQNKNKSSPIKAVRGSSQTDFSSDLLVPDGIEYCVRDEEIVDKESISIV
jgi:hypothetical protein